jgi:putative membrane protein
MLLLAAEATPWRWQPHVEVWMVVAGVVALGVYVARVIAPKVPDGGITRAQKAWFALGVVLLWLSADWPLHDLAEQYLYWLHMVQHFVLTLVVPPVFWLATPRWLARLLVPEGSQAERVLRMIARPVPAAVVFNALVVATHWTGIVNASVASAPVHYLVHLVLVASAFVMWIPVCGPWPELRLGPAATCIYLFAQSIVPTVPGAWLTLAEAPVYAAYDHLPRLWGIGAVTDQQYAGLFMKLGAGAYLWGLIILIFFRWALAHEREQHRYNLVRLEDAIDA